MSISTHAADFTSQADLSAGLFGKKEKHTAKTLQGTPVSPGYASGTLVIYRSPRVSVIERRFIEPDEVEKELSRFAAAIDHAAGEVSLIRQQVAADVGETEASIFDAHLAMLRDPLLNSHVQERLRKDNLCAESALAEEMKTFCEQLTAGGNDYMRELVMDARDVGNRLLRHLVLDEGQRPLANLPENSVIAARDLTPSETVSMNLDNVSGIATEQGGPTSHTAILARSLGIPAVTGLTGLLEGATPGTVCLLNGTKGTVVINPSEPQRKRFAGLRRQFEQSQHLMRQMENRACRLTNGTRIKLRANINQAGDVNLANEHHLDGIGLYRTELMYLSALSPPSPATQCRHFRRAAGACAPRPITIRTFDFAADKHPSFLSIDPASPMELRGLQFALNYPRLFKSQIRAIVRCARDFPNTRILFPMVTGWWELQEALDLVKAASEEEKLEQPLPVGAMIETPAAIFALPEIVKLVDFISIGCNDLARFTLARERNTAGQTISENALHPSLLRAIQQIVRTAEQANCPVSICGEAASAPIMASVFAGLGIRELSVSPARAPVVRYALRHVSLETAVNAAERAMHAAPSAAMKDLQQTIPEELQKILSLEPVTKHLRSGLPSHQRAANGVPAAS